MAAKNQIWRIATSSSSAQGAKGAGSNVTLDFDDVVVDDSQFMNQKIVDIDIDISQTSALKGDNNPKQDGGVGSVTIPISGFIKGKTALAGRKTLLRWALEPKFTTAFPHGRFGTVFENFEEFNIEPVGDADTGYAFMIGNVQLTKESEYQNKTSFTMDLIYNGRVAGIIANL